LKLTRLRARPPAGGHSETLDRRPRATSKDAVEVRVGAVADDQPVTRHRAHEMMKLRFDCGEIGKYIGMIEF
jgi:hypothetical protein